MAIKKKIVTEKHEEKILELKNFWQFLAFVIVEAPSMFFATIFGIVIIILALKFSGKIGSIVFQKTPTTKIEKILPNQFPSVELKFNKTNK